MTTTVSLAPDAESVPAEDPRHPARRLPWSADLARPEVASAMLAGALGVACPVHGVGQGEACWVLPPDVPGLPDHLAACGTRVTAALAHAERVRQIPSPQTPARPSRRPPMRGFGPPPRKDQQVREEAR